MKINYYLCMKMEIANLIYVQRIPKVHVYRQQCDKPNGVHMAVKYIYVVDSGEFFRCKFNNVVNVPDCSCGSLQINIKFERLGHLGCNICICKITIIFDLYLTNIYYFINKMKIKKNDNRYLWIKLLHLQHSTQVFCSNMINKMYSAPLVASFYESFDIYTCLLLD